MQMKIHLKYLSSFVLGWPIFIKRFAKICLIFKSRTVLESSDQMQLKLLKSFSSKSLFKELKQLQ